MRNSAERVDLNCRELPRMGDWRLLFLHRDRLKSVPPEDARESRRRTSSRRKPDVGIYIPTKEPARAEIAPPPDVVSLLNDYKGGEAMTVGEAFDPSAASVEGACSRATMPGSSPVAGAEEDARGTVNVAMTFRFGDEAGLKGAAPPATSPARC